MGVLFLLAMLIVDAKRVNEDCYDESDEDY